MAVHYGRLVVQNRQVRLKYCAVKLSLAFGSENGEEMAIYISEVGDPVGWRDLVRFRGKGDSLRGQVPVGCSYGFYLKNNFCCSSDVGRSMNVSATQPQHYSSALQQGKLGLLHDHLKTQLLLIKRQRLWHIAYAEHDCADLRKPDMLLHKGLPLDLLSRTA